MCAIVHSSKIFIMQNFDKLEIVKSSQKITVQDIHHILLNYQNFAPIKLYE